MSKRDKRRAVGNAAERASSGAQNTGGVLFDTEQQSAADVWGNGASALDGDSVMDGIYGGSAPSAAELEKKLETAMVPEGSDMVLGNWRLTPVGLQAPDEVSVEEYQQIGEVLLGLESRLQWLIGDWIVYGDQFEWGQTYEQLATDSGYEVQTLRDYAYVCRNVDLSIRIDILTFGHHQVVTSMEPDKQAYWLQRAAQGDDGKRWSIKQMREAIKAEQGRLPEPRTALDKLADSLNRFIGGIDKKERLQAATLLREMADRLESLD